MTRTPTGPAPAPVFAGTLPVETHRLCSGDWSVADAAWEALFAATPTASAYLGPLWVRTWVQVYGPVVRPDVCLVRQQRSGPVVGAFLLTRRTHRRAILPLVRAHLNTDGERDGDSVVVEHNAVLSAPGNADAVMAALSRHLAEARVDEFRASGVDEASAAALTRAFAGWTPFAEWRVSPYVDLDRLRAGGGDHLAGLSRNTREQLRRSLRRYGERGPLHLEAARTVAEAEEMLEELIGLHEARWRAKGQGGGFASPLRRRFHAAYVRAAVPAGAAQLLRIRNGDATIGVLYNLVANGRVAFYQSGLRYEDDKHLKPGLTAHHLAIGHCAALGLAEYDFLVSGANEGRYKESLANAERSLAWVTLSRPGWRHRYFAAARAMRDVMMRRRRRAGRSSPG